MRYAEMTENICTNIAECDDPGFAAEMGWVSLPDGLGIGDALENGNWTRSESKTELGPPPVAEPPWKPLEDRILFLEQQMSAMTVNAGAF